MHMLNDLDTTINTFYPLASDDAIRSARRTYAVLLADKDLGSVEFPSKIQRYENALNAIRSSHAFKTNELFEMSFANERRRVEV